MLCLVYCCSAWFIYFVRLQYKKEGIDILCNICYFFFFPLSTNIHFPYLPSNPFFLDTPSSPPNVQWTVSCIAHVSKTITREREREKEKLTKDCEEGQLLAEEQGMQKQRDKETKRDVGQKFYSQIFYFIFFCISRVQSTASQEQILSRI